MPDIPLMAHILFLLLCNARGGGITSNSVFVFGPVGKSFFRFSAKSTRRTVFSGKNWRERQRRGGPAATPYPGLRPLVV